MDFVYVGYKVGKVIEFFVFEFKIKCFLLFIGIYLGKVSLVFLVNVGKVGD